VLGDYVFFTNGFDTPLYCQTDPPEYNALQPISDLSLIGLSVARKMWVWRNCLFLADVVMDGSRISYRFLWSDYNNPTSFDPSIQGSITGFQDLEYGDRILGGMPCGNSFIICTTLGFWELYVVSTTSTESTTTGTTTTTTVNETGAVQGQVFGIQKLPGISPKTALFYENTLINVGDGILYMGRDRIYYFNLNMAAPEPLEWLHLADILIYQNIQSMVCEAHIGVYDYTNSEAYFSVLTSNSTNGCPDVTLRINWQYKTVDFIDAGFTAMVDYRPQSVPTVRDWMIDQQICTPMYMAGDGFGWVYEGLPNPIPEPTAPFQPEVIITHAAMYVDGVTTEQWCAMYPNANEFECTIRTPDGDSLCALMTAEGLTSIFNYCQKCDSNPVLIGASSNDWCLKEFGEYFYRERCTNPTAVGSNSALGYTSATGSYLLDSYSSIIRFAVIFSPDALVTLERVTLNFLANAPGAITGRIGLSGQLVDPNVPNPCIKWNPISVKQLQCLSKLTPAQMQSKNIVPDKELRWDFLYSAKYVYVELSISGTLTDALFSGIVLNAGSKAIKY
jgi:hypothetical protein